MSSHRNTKIRLAVSCEHQVKKKKQKKREKNTKNYCQEGLHCFFRAQPLLRSKNHHPGLSPLDSKSGQIPSVTCSPTLPKTNPKPKEKTVQNQLSTYTGNGTYYTSSPSMWYILRFKCTSKGNLQNEGLEIKLRPSLAVLVWFNTLYPFCFASLANVIIGFKLLKSNS